MRSGVDRLKMVQLLNYDTRCHSSGIKDASRMKGAGGPVNSQTPWRWYKPAKIKQTKQNKKSITTKVVMREEKLGKKENEKPYKLGRNN